MTEPRFQVGQRVALAKDIWEDEIDGLIPPGYLGRRGDVVFVKRTTTNSKYQFPYGVAHEGRDGSFGVREDEIREVDGD